MLTFKELFSTKERQFSTIKSYSINSFFQIPHEKDFFRLHFKNIQNCEKIDIKSNGLLFDTIQVGDKKEILHFSDPFPYSFCPYVHIEVYLYDGKCDLNIEYIYCSPSITKDIAVINPYIDTCYGIFTLCEGVVKQGKYPCTFSTEMLKPILNDFPSSKKYFLDTDVSLKKYYGDLIEDNLYIYKNDPPPLSCQTIPSKSIIVEFSKVKEFESYLEENKIEIKFSREIFETNEEKTREMIARKKEEYNMNLKDLLDRVHINGVPEKMNSEIEVLTGKSKGIIYYENPPVILL